MGDDDGPEVPQATVEPFHFLHLPIEIRIKIYEKCLVRKFRYDGPLEIVYPPIGHAEMGHRHELSAALLRVCKQVYYEAKEVLWKENRFETGPGPGLGQSWGCYSSDACALRDAYPDQPDPLLAIWHKLHGQETTMLVTTLAIGTPTRTWPLFPYLQQFQNLKTLVVKFSIGWAFPPETPTAAIHGDLEWIARGCIFGNLKAYKDMVRLFPGVEIIWETYYRLGADCSIRNETFQFSLTANYANATIRPTRRDLSILRGVCIHNLLPRTPDLHCEGRALIAFFKELNDTGCARIRNTYRSLELQTDGNNRAFPSME